MTGSRVVAVLLACALGVAACGSAGDDADVAGTSPPTDAASATEPTEGEATGAATDAATPGPTKPATPIAVDGEDEDGLEPAAAPTDPDPTGGPTADEPPAQVATGTRPELSGIEDRSAVARQVETPEGGIADEDILIDEDFSTTTPVMAPVEGPAGTGGIGRLDDRRFYELTLNAGDGHLAVPIQRVAHEDSTSIYVQATSFLTSFSGLAAMDRGVYCWAQDGNDPLAGARYELLYGTEGEVQVVRYDADGQPAALLIDEVHDPVADTDDDGPDDTAATHRIGLLCRPDDQGRAQILVRVERTYWVTTDDGGPDPGGGIGVVVAGRGGASTETIATVPVLLVADGSQLPFV